MKILHLDSSILGAASASRTLTQAIVAELLRRHPGATVAYRDLVADPIAHLDGTIAAGFRPVQGPANANTAAEHARSQALVDELLASEVLVIGAPMYNFSVASQLKAWIDRVVQPGRTFQYTERGPMGLAGGRRVIVASARGGTYSTGALAPMDFQEAYLRAVFAFIGITDLEVVRAENLSRGAAARELAMHAALAKTAGVAQTGATAA